MPETKFLDCTIRMPLMKLPVRSVALKLSKGTVLLSPGSELSKEELLSAGDVTDIVAPNLFHGAGMERAAEVFPKARVWGVEGAQAARPAVPFTHNLNRDPWIHEEELRHIPLEGIKPIRESVFVDRAGRTLYVADLFFNMRDARGLGARIILGLFGTYRRFSMSKFFLSRVDDRPAFEASLKRLVSQDFDRVVMAHGEALAPAHAAVVAAIRERGFRV